MEVVIVPMDTNEKPEEETIPVEPVAPDRIVEIAHITAGQTSNSNWFAYRRNRITGSIFGKVLDAFDRPTVIKLLNIKRAVRGELNLDHLEPIKWGRDNELNAIAAYCNKRHYFVKPTGLWLFPSGQLGASPDGLVYESEDSDNPIGIVEVKCPFFVRDRHFMELHRSGRMPAYITADFRLNRDHDYYHQVQGELYATGANWCDFVMWTTKSCFITRVYPNTLWAAECIPKLTDFYEKVIKNK
jgi:hypothetical protein